MTSIMDLGENAVDPHVEVRKLQDLVKKLETQNEVLRTKQKFASDSNLFEENDKQFVNNSVFYNKRKHSEKRDSPVTVTNSDFMDTIELIDIEKSVSDVEDSWLYTSPRPATPQQAKVSPYKWVRQEFDHPSKEIQSAKKSLKYKLDEAARMSRSSSTPALTNYSTPPRGNPAAMSLSADSTPSPRQDSTTSPRLQGGPVSPKMVEQPNATPDGRLGRLSYLQGNKIKSRLNTGTFTRPKKNKDLSPPSENHVDDMKENMDAPKQHPNVADIENMAKLQEEKLREGITQTSPRRGFRSRPLPNVANFYLENENSSPNDSNRSSPNRYEEGMNRRNSQSNSVGSDHSSPPDSPYGSSQYLHPPTTGASNLRGSLPNVSRLTPRTQHHASDSSLADYQYEDQQSYPEHRYNNVNQNSRLQGQYARPSSPSLNSLKQPVRTARGPSPQRTGLPQPRRSIARPASAGPRGIPGPRRSGIPASPRPSNMMPRPLDNTWREGCF